MRSLIVVGVVMAVVGLGAVIFGILSIGRVVSTAVSGRLECNLVCDPIGDLPLLVGGGIALIVTGVIVASLGSSLTSAKRQSLKVTKRVLSSTSPSRRDANSVTAPAITGEVAPMLRQMLRSLQASGLLDANAAPVQLLDSATGRPMAATTAHDAASDAERDRLLRATGTLARAVVDSVRELPMSSPEGQLCELHLDVRPEDRPSYKVRHYAVVPTRWAYRVTMGASFPAWVDPADPSRLLIEWERS